MKEKTMRKFTLISILIMLALLVASCAPAATSEAPEAPEAPEAEEAEAEAPAEAEEVTITIESWRNDDLTIWQDMIIPAFEAKYPNIHVEFTPTAPAEYNGVLNTKLEGGTAGDLITCRPFDASLALFDKGYLSSLNNLAGMDNFSNVAKSAWITDNSSDVFCVPMASVIHGFFYNADAFSELGIEEPATREEFFTALEAIKADGGYAPLGMGSADQWEAATMGFQNIGPNYWKGEEGRQALISGEQKYTDQAYVDTWAELASWADYMPDGFEAVKYPDAQSLFTLGKAAIYPTGSWEISVFEDQAEFEMGIFPPPLANEGDTCYISDHTDIALGMNASTENPEAAQTFLEWMTTPEFAELYSNALPGFFTLSNHQISLDDPLAQEFLSWREPCEETIRNSYQILSRGEPNLENELWRVSAAVINGSLTPEEAAQEIQDGLDKWYTPAEAPVTEAPEAPAEDVTLTIESWRNDDLTIWQDSIIPAFEAQYPTIHIEFAPTAPAEYNGVLNTKLEGGTAGDLITCRPFDASLALFDKGQLASINDLAGMENFSDVAKSAWITDDGSDVFCVPMASVIHGFFYNADAFSELGLEEPATRDEFFTTLDAIKTDGGYAPLGMGSADQWEAATMGFQNIGPNYWKGEEGRQALISGEQKYTDQAYVDTWAELASWADYMPSGFEAVKYPDAQSLFTLGKAAIYPTGSWEISVFEDQAEFEMGIFPPPVGSAGDTCYISDHTDIALGMNTATENPEAAKIFLQWMTTPEFAELYSNALPGFFTLSNHKINLDDPLAKEFLSWREACEETIRNSYQILSRGEPNLENELWRVSAAVINGSLTPEEAAQEIQDGLDKWYTP
jgi:raffinose/stachyose/melibiose transport system substrate-binding protein